MSNCIQVGDEYHPFRWEGETLLAWLESDDGSGEWVRVERTNRKNERGEWVFRVVR